MRLLLMALIPVFVMCAKILAEDVMTHYRNRPKRKKQPSPVKTYHHKWDDDDE